MYDKLTITADLIVRTGLHIGGSNVFSAIGAVDSPVVKDARTQLPILPGSSLKGKLRTLMARSRSQSYMLCKPDEDPIEVARLFGTAQKFKDCPALPTRLQFCDCFLKKESVEQLREIGTTEIKFENTINRLTAVANPRQIERVVRGSVFDFMLGYDLMEEAEVTEDFQNLADGLALLQMDYLGGHGSRGYGRVAFRHFAVTAAHNCLPPETIAHLTAILKGAETGDV